MKNLLLSVFLLIGFFAYSQSGVTWSSSYTVATSSYGNMHPRITVDGSNNPLVLWGNAMMQKAYFARWNGTAFTMPLTLNPSSIPVFAQSWAGPDIASKGDTVYVAYKQTPEDTNHIYLVHSFDGGVNFSAPSQVDFIADSVSRFPAVTTDDNGNPIVAFMKFDPNFMNARFVVTKSADYGNTFSADVPASGFSGGNVCDCCPAGILNSGNTVAVLYRDNLNNMREMWAGISTSSGNDFPSGFNVDQTNWLISMCPSSGPDGIIIGDSLYTTWMSSASGMSLVYWSKSSISNMISGPSIPLTGNFPGLTVQNFPRMAHSGNAAAITWKQSVNGVAQIGIFFTNNIYNGFPAVYDTIAFSASNNIVNADVFITPGVIHVVWQDDNSGTVKYRKGTFNPTSLPGDLIAAENKINVFPNPAKNDVTVQWNKNLPDIISLNIIDIAGRDLLIPCKLENGKATLQLSSLNPGIFFIRLTDSEGKSFYKKLLISGQ
jgi:type IX secretion system substrate protein